MIHGIGTDIVGVARLQHNLDRYGERFAARILDSQELEAFRRAAQPGPFLAKRFAAKEALVKALGTGFRQGIGLRDIGVRNDALGKPELAFSTRMDARLRSHGIAVAHLSLSDERDYAIAFVVLERA